MTTTAPDLRVVQADARRLPLPDNTVDLVVTSPPYWTLRSYQDGGEHYDGQIGVEATVGEYIDALIDATRESVRVLKPTGSMFVNLGDTYRQKTLTSVPARYAIRATDDLGLFLRAEIIWEKPHVYGDKATDRVRRTHETWLHLTPGKDYYTDLGALRAPAVNDYQNRPQYRRAVQLFEENGFTPAHLAAVKAVGVADTAGGAVRSGGRWDSESGRLAAEVRTALRSYYRELCGSNTDPRGIVAGSVWTIATESLKLSGGLTGHFASFPVEWPLRLIPAFCPPGGTVLDPFGGTGTTAHVAHALGRTGITVDASADYCRIAAHPQVYGKRAAKVAKRIAEQVAAA